MATNWLTARRILLQVHKQTTTTKQVTRKRNENTVSIQYSRLVSKRCECLYVITISTQIYGHFVALDWKISRNFIASSVAKCKLNCNNNNNNNQSMNRHSHNLIQFGKILVVVVCEIQFIGQIKAMIKRHQQWFYLHLNWIPLYWMYSICKFAIHECFIRVHEENFTTKAVYYHTNTMGWEAMLLRGNVIVISLVDWPSCSQIEADSQVLLASVIWPLSLEVVVCLLYVITDAFAWVIGL